MMFKRLLRVIAKRWTPLHGSDPGFSVLIAAERQSNNARANVRRHFFSNRNFSREMEACQQILLIGF
jgi:hypothetical protein